MELEYKGFKNGYICIFICVCVCQDLKAVLINIFVRWLCLMRKGSLILTIVLSPDSAVHRSSMKLYNILLFWFSLTNLTSVISSRSYFQEETLALRKKWGNKVQVCWVEQDEVTGKWWESLRPVAQVWDDKIWDTSQTPYSIATWTSSRSGLPSCWPAD